MRASPEAGFPYCPTLPTPPPAAHATAHAFPASSLATTAINWTDPAASSLRYVLVNRRQGSCPTYPSVPGVSPIPIRPSGTPLRGTTIAYRVGRAGRAVGARHRQDRSGALVLQRLDDRPRPSLHALGERVRADRTAAGRGHEPGAHGQRDALAGHRRGRDRRRGDAALPAAADARGRCHPRRAHPGHAVRRRPRIPSARSSRSRHPCPGEIAVTDSTDLTPGPWCYIVRIQLADRDYEPALVQVDVPAAPRSHRPLPCRSTFRPDGSRARTGSGG